MVDDEVVRAQNARRQLFCTNASESDASKCPGLLRRIVHSLRAAVLTIKRSKNPFRILVNTNSLYRIGKFLGLCLDTGAQKSVSGIAQAKSFANQIGLEFKLRPLSDVYRFCDDASHSMSVLRATIPTPEPTSSITVNVDLVRSDIPMIICLPDLRRYGLLAYYTDKVSFCKVEGWHFPLRNNHGQVFCSWRTSSVNYSRLDLVKLHKHFNHAYPDNLYDLLRCADPQKNWPIRS